MRKTISVAIVLILLLLAGCAPGSTITQHPASGSSPDKQETTTPARSTQPAGIFTHPITYIALGASDAVGVGSDAPGSQGYVPLIAARLPKGSRLLDLGISGIQLHEALSEELPLALSNSPALITIWLVANDFIGGVTYPDYMQDLTTLLTQLRAHTHARIVMANLPDLTRLPAFANQTAAQKTQMLASIQQWNNGIAQDAARYGVTLLDLFSRGSLLTAHPEYISSDGFHPSAAGYAQLADLFWQAIQQQ